MREHLARVDPFVFASELRHVLPERDVDGRGGFGEEARIGDVGDDADDLTRLGLAQRAVAGRPDRDADRLAQRIFSREVAIGERLVDHRHPRRRRDVFLVNRASAQQPDAERVEHLRVDLVQIGDRLLAGLRRRAADDLERMRPHVQRQPADHAGASHARQRPHAREQLVVEDLGLRGDEVGVLRGLVEVLRAAEEDVGGQQPVGVEAGQIALLPEEAAHHQTGADEEHHRERDLHDQERAPRAATAAARSARTFLQDFIRDRLARRAAPAPVRTPGWRGPRCRARIRARAHPR